MASKTKLRKREHGTGTIIKDGKRFYLRVMILGKLKTSMLRNANGTPCTRQEEALAAAEVMRPLLLARSKEEVALHIEEARKLKKRSGLLLNNAWDTFLKQPNRPDSAESTLKNHFNTFNQFLKWIANTHLKITRVAEIDVDIAKDYFSYIWSTGISAKRYNDVIISLRLIFRHLADPAGIELNPFDKIIKKTQEISSRKEFTPEQINAIFDGFETGFFYKTISTTLKTKPDDSQAEKTVAFNPMHKAELKVLLNLCCWTGCRGQDGCLMQWNNIDFASNRISYIPRKTARRTNHKAITLPLHSMLREALLKALEWRTNNASREDFILPSIAKRYNHNPSGIQKDVMKIIECATGLSTTSTTTTCRRKLAVNNYSLHSFRHSFVSFCANAGVPLAVVAEIVGHGNPAMTKHYSHISTEAKQKAIALLPAINNQPEPQTSNIENNGSDDNELKNLIKKLNPDQKIKLINYIKKLR